jgi:hypothetical protein
MTALADWLELTVLHHGRHVPVTLGFAAFGDIAPFTREPVGQSEASRRSSLRLALAYDIASFDSHSMRLADADRIMADPPAHAAILEKRNALYERGRAAGRAWARCPHCDSGEIALSLLSFATRFGAEAPYLTAADPSFLLPPSLSIEHKPGARPPDAAHATRIRFALPSAAIGLGPPKSPAGGDLGTIVAKREASALKRWAPDGVEPPEGRAWWRSGNPCFRALVGLSIALERFETGGKADPARLAGLPAIDIYFLDALYYLTHFVDVTPNAVADACPVCRLSFFPVL